MNEKEKTFYLTKNDFILAMKNLNTKQTTTLYDNKGQLYTLFLENDYIIAYKNAQNLPNKLNTKTKYQVYLATCRPV